MAVPRWRVLLCRGLEVRKILCMRRLLPLAAVAVGLFLLPHAAEAQIGLSHTERGHSYLSVDGGYQNSDAATAALPQAGGTNPFPAGVGVLEFGIARPDVALAVTGAGDPGAGGAGGTAVAEPGSSEANAGSTVFDGGRSAFSYGSATSSATATDAESSTESESRAINGGDTGEADWPAPRNGTSS